MGKIGLLAKLFRVHLPAPLAGFLIPRRDRYRGALIDVKACALGRLASYVRGFGPMPAVAESRVQMAKTALMFDRKAPDLARIEDISVAGADGPIKARLYCDHTDARLRPAMVYLHGGGFVQGDLETHHALCAKIAKWWGGIVVAIDYRLAPEHPFPAGVDDAISAYLDLVKRGAALGIDPKRIGVAGDSAGGCFAAVLAQQVRDANGPVPKFQVLIYPVTDGHINSESINDLVDAYILPKQRMVWYRDMYAGDFRDFDDAKFSPLFADDFSGLPNSYIVTGGFDPLRDDGASYAQKLQDAAVPVVHRHFAGQIHAFVNLTKVVPEGTQALREIADWLGKTCKT